MKRFFVFYLLFILNASAQQVINIFLDKNCSERDIVRFFKSDARVRFVKSDFEEIDANELAVGLKKGKQFEDDEIIEIAENFACEVIAIERIVQ